MHPESLAAPTPPRGAQSAGAVKFGLNQVVVEFREVSDFGIEFVLFRVQLRDVRSTSPHEVHSRVAGVDLEEPLEMTRRSANCQSSMWWSHCSRHT